MAEPSQAKKWYFTQKQLDETPSREYLTSSQELNLRQQATNLIQDIGQKIKVTQLCINTAIVYMHRFYCFHSFNVYHRNAIAPAAIFLAAKIEEQPRKLMQVISVCYNLLNRTNTDKKTPNYTALADELIRNEAVLISTLGFDLRIEHPHTFIVRFSSVMNVPKDVAQTCYFMATNSLHLTTMCLQYEPNVVACFCIYFVMKWSSNQIPVSKHGKPWYQYIDENVTEELLEKMTVEFFKIYDKCPARLKKRVDFDVKQMNSEKRSSIGSNNSGGSNNTTTTTTASPSTSSNTTMSVFHSHHNPAKPQTHTSATTTAAVSNLSKPPPPPQLNNHEIIKTKSDLNRPTTSSSSSSSQNNLANWSFSDKHSNNVMRIDSSQSSSSSGAAAFGNQSNRVSNHTSTLQHPSSSSHSNRSYPHTNSTITGNAKSNLPSVSLPHDTTAAISRHGNPNPQPNCLPPPYKKPSSTFGQADTKYGGGGGHNLAAGRSWQKTTSSIPATNYHTSSSLHGKDSYSSHSVTNFNHKEVVEPKVQPSLVTDQSALISDVVKEVARQAEEEKQRLNNTHSVGLHSIIKTEPKDSSNNTSTSSNSVTKRNHSMFSPIRSSDEKIEADNRLAKIPKMTVKNESGDNLILNVSIPHLPSDFKMPSSSSSSSITQKSACSISTSSHLNNVNTDSSGNVITSIKSESSSSTHSHHKKKKKHKEKSKSRDKDKKKHHKDKDQDREKLILKFKLGTTPTAVTTANSIPNGTSGGVSASLGDANSKAHHVSGNDKVRERKRRHNDDSEAVSSKHGRQ